MREEHVDSNVVWFRMLPKRIQKEGKESSNAYNIVRSNSGVIFRGAYLAVNEVVEWGEALAPDVAKVGRV